MQGTLLVTPEKLISTAQTFNSAAGTVQNITSQMLDLARRMGNTWIGEAYNAYNNKFQALEEDMGQMYRMITEHSNDLQEMARNYQAAEQANTEVSNALSSNAIT